MTYYVKEIQHSKQNARTAGVKARDDLEEIFEKEGLEKILISTKYEKREQQRVVQKLLTHFIVAQAWKRNTVMLASGDTLYIQFPAEEHSIFLGKEIKALKKRGVRIVLFIHDLEMFRYAKREDFSFRRRARVYLEEKTILELADFIVVHNESMKEILLENLDINETKVLPIGIFDYLIPGFDNKSVKESTKNAPVIISGNLLAEKSGYVYKLPKDIQFNLYGVNYRKQNKDNIHYYGSFSPDKIPFAMSGSFGLVWDGDSIETCSGPYGEYLRINNPHKTSLYLACGIPVIIWEESALANFVKDKDVGIIIQSLQDISEILNSITDERYQILKKNAAVVSASLREGIYTKNVIKTLQGLHDGQL